MNFEKALIMLMDYPEKYKEIRRRSWEKGSHLRIYKSLIYWDNSAPFHPSTEEIRASNWEIIENVKKTYSNGES